MKQKNEEILQRWRNLGFLKGLKEGSINEWRCAKSFDNMANYCLQNNICGSICTLSFPLIRRVLCTGKNRIYRIIESEWVVDIFNKTTLNECVDEFLKIPSKSKKTQKFREEFGNAFKMYIDIADICDMSVGDFFDQYCLESPNEPIKYAKVLGCLCDIEAEILSIVADKFVSQFADKLSDALNVGDEFETDKGEKMKVIGIDENGDVLTEFIVN